MQGVKRGPGRPRKFGRPSLPVTVTLPEDVIAHLSALISLEPPRSVPQLELDIRDALDHQRFGRLERQALEAIANILCDARLSKNVTVEERTIIVLEAKRRRSS